MFKSSIRQDLIVLFDLSELMRVLNISEEEREIKS